MWIVVMYLPNGSRREFDKHRFRNEAEHQAQRLKRLTGNHCEAMFEAPQEARQEANCE